jgi:hypothetical protein
MQASPIPSIAGESNRVVAFFGARQPELLSSGEKFSETKVEVASSAEDRAEVPLKIN